jgi:hypothetical protein
MYIFPRLLAGNPHGRAPPPDQRRRLVDHHLDRPSRVPVGRANGRRLATAHRAHPFGARGTGSKLII